MYLFFDVETTGVPKNKNASFKELNNWPRITQIAFQSYSEGGELINAFSTLIKPDGWVVPTDKFFIDNGMSTERCENHGVPIKPVLEKFAEEINRCQYLLAHNLAFDASVVYSEFYKIGLVAQNKPLKICTMKASTQILKLPGQYDYKWPSLKELHNFLFNCDFEGAHDAGDDVSATAKCYFELKKRGYL